MEKIDAYGKLISDIQKELSSLELEINDIPEINPLNLLFNCFNESKFNALYSKLEKLRAKTKNGLDYYEIYAVKRDIDSKANDEQEMVANQEDILNQDAIGNTETNARQELVTNQRSETSQEINLNEEIHAIKENYFSQLIDLLADINFLEKRLQQKDGKKLINDA